MTQPDPDRYPAGTRVLVEAIVREDGDFSLVHPRAPRAPQGCVVHSTVAEHEQLQAELDTTRQTLKVKCQVEDDFHAAAAARIRQLDEHLAALRAERDNLAANNARLRQELGEVGRFASRAAQDLADEEREHEALRAEVTRIADACHSTAGLHGGLVAALFLDAEDRLRAALAAEQAGQTPPDVVR